MAAKKKARKKPKSKSKPKTRAKKKVVKKRSAAKKAVRVKAVKKKATKKAAAKKKVTARKPAAKKARPAPRPVPAVAAVPAGEVRLGVVTHYYSHLMVAVVRVEAGTLSEGDTIHIKGHTSDFRQRAGSMELDRVQVPVARAGQSVGLKVIDHAREHDVVYRVSNPQA
jgi:translation elongation factor EF-Tu-like GTPase